MFGLDFLFAAALFALPLAGAPLLLHLLFRRKSPTVQFSTLRFIRASIQQTAAKRKLHRWLLLACRILLLALLIWTIAQPVKRLQANWTGAAHSTIAAIVVDTSFSMQLRDADVSLLQRADRAVQDLLRSELKDARVGLFTSRENPGGREQLTTASAMLSEWAPLNPEASARPLADRVAAARNMLARQAADQKWLVVLSDLQSREFPRPMENVPEQRTVLIDLHPDIARSAGITNVSINPPQPIPGVGSEITIDVAGRSGESRAISIRVLKPDGSVLLQPPPAMANFDTGGRASIRVPIKLPAEPWLLVEAQFSEEDAMPWDDARSVLVHLPPRQGVRILDFTNGAPASRFVRLALDPNEGKLAAWPLEVRSGDQLRDDDRVTVALLARWPDQDLAEGLTQFANGGRTVILFVQPGLETLWPNLPDAQRAAWMTLLPAAPADTALATAAHVLPLQSDQILLSDVMTGADLQSAQVRRMIRFDPNPRSAETVLNVSRESGSKIGLLFRKTIGEGQVFTFATLPDARYTNLATHPIFLPMLVRLALQSPAQRDLLNVEIGHPLTWSIAGGNNQPLTIQSPAHETFQVAPKSAFDQANHPGLYTWQSGGAIVGYSNVQPPAAESELVYRPADSVIALQSSVLAARSLDEIRQKMQQLAEPEPRWSVPMALVLVLLCVEALLGSLSGMRSRTALTSKDVAMAQAV